MCIRRNQEPLFGGQPWINEIHTTNVGIASDLGVEVAGLAGAQLTGYRLEFHDLSQSPSLYGSLVCGRRRQVRDALQLTRLRARRISVV